MTTKQIIAGLQSADEKQIQKSLSALKVDGSVQVLHPLAHLLATDTDRKYAPAILEVFSSLKDSGAVEPMMEILKDDAFSSIRQELLSTVWNSALDYTFYFPDFVLFATEGDFMVALDCLTILENMPGPFEERHILESQWYLKEYLEDEAPKEERKAQIMSEIALLVKDIDRNIEG